MTDDFGHAAPKRARDAANADVIPWLPYILGLLYAAGSGEGEGGGHEEEVGQDGDSGIGMDSSDGGIDGDTVTVGGYRTGAALARYLPAFVAEGLAPPMNLLPSRKKVL